MKQFKTDQFGFYGGPHQNYVIEGDESSTPITTNNLPYPIIATSPDGTTKMLSSNENTIFPGNTVVEMKAQMGAQVGDQREQMMQLISAYCQVTGGDESCSQKVMQGLQENPQEMVQQMVAVVQQAQQSQQSQQPQEQMMAKDGGCMDCQEQFPQAQNLNWFYKAGGGEAFPQANMYPESWAGYSGMQYEVGGESFPQAQTYLPYDRPGETRLNGMAEYGGQSDLDRAYQMMKQGGFDMDPKKKRGGKFDAKSFQDYVMKNGGLPKAQFGPPSEDDFSVYGQVPRNPYVANPYTADNDMASFKWDVPRGTNVLKEPIYSPNPEVESTPARNMAGTKKRPSGPTRPEPTGMGMYYVNALAGASKNPSLKRMAALVNTVSGGIDAAKGWYKLGDALVDNVKRVTKSGRYAEDAEDIEARYGGLPKAQNAGQWSAQSTFQPWNPNYGFTEQQREQSAWEQYNKQNPMMGYDAFLGSNVTQNTQGQDVSFKPGSIADPSNPGFQRPGGPESMPEKEKKKSKYKFNDPATMTMKASRSIGKLAMATNLMADARRIEEERKRNRMTGSTDVGYMPTVAQQNLGNYMVNTSSGEPFRPNQQVFPQDIGTPVTPMAATYNTRQGGSIFDRYKDGGVYNLTMDEIRKIYEEGGEIEFLED